MIPPKVTVLLPVYNSERFIHSAIESVLEQTFQDFELLVIDDGSTDRTPAILAEFNDPRLRIVRNPQNLRLIESLNRGLKLAQGKYIARMDADDICHPERLEKQVQFLEAHREVDVVGSDIIIFEDNPKQGFRPLPPPTSNAQIRWELLKTCCLYHPAVMVRRSVFETEGAYDPNYTHCEDYELWLRLSRRRRLENLPLPLLYYRRHPGSITFMHSAEQQGHSERALGYEIERRIGKKPSSLVTKLLKEPHRLAEMNDITEFRQVFSQLLAEMLSQPKLTTQDRIYIRLSAMTMIGRLLIQAIRRRPGHLKAVISMLLFDLKLDIRSALRIPFYLAQTVSRRTGIF